MPGSHSLGDILIHRKVIQQKQLQEALARQKQRGGVLGKILIEIGACAEDDVRAALAEQAGFQAIDLEQAEIPADVIRLVSGQMAVTYQIVPVAIEGNILSVAMSNPTDLQVIDDLRVLLGYEIKPIQSSETAIKKALEKHYAGHVESIEDIYAEMKNTNIEGLVAGVDDKVDLQKLQEIADAAPVKKFLNMILLQAIRDRASDIHFEPFENEFKIRYRIDGILYEMMPPPAHLGLALTSRIKVMANLDIAERRLPQDGRIYLSKGGAPVELRVSTLPTMVGESVVMRVLDRATVALELERVGMREDELRSFRELIKKPHGIILVTGPTGSGKTTTLYSALREVNTIDVKIITVEDPVEYDIAGVVQVEADDAAERTFANALRSILRQDPDIILVGEIRDRETASLAIEASLTGHLVFSTLHTNDAPTAITRLIELGVEPYLLAATLEAVIAQRLVRTICPKCRTTYQPSREELMELNLQDVAANWTFHYGKRCENCNKSGYKGRTAIFEMMVMHDDIRDMVVRQVSTNEIRKAAIRSGMRPLRQSGLLAIQDGLTTVEEVLRATQLGV